MVELIPCDLHVHPDYSIDARPSIDEYCRRAKQIGINEVVAILKAENIPFRPFYET